MESAIAKTKEKAQQAAAEAKRRAQVAQQAAKARMEQAKEAQVVRSAPVASPLLTCLKCQAPIQADDLFCGSCGHRAG